MAIPQQVLLINGDYIRQYTELNQSVEAAYLRPAILKAQDMEIQPILGTDLMTKIQEDTADASITGAYLTLKDTYLKRALCEWTMYYLIPLLDIKIDNGGIVQRISENTTSPTSASIQRLMDQHLQAAKFYTQRMYDYLCENSSSFPEWQTNNTGQLWAQQNKTAAMGIVSRGNYGKNVPHNLRDWPYRIKNQ